MTTLPFIRRLNWPGMIQLDMHSNSLVLKMTSSVSCNVTWLCRTRLVKDFRVYKLFLLMLLPQNKGVKKMSPVELSDSNYDSNRYQKEYLICHITLVGYPLELLECQVKWLTFDTLRINR